MFSPIAIIGQSCLLPGAHNPEQLWHLIRERKTAISPAPATRWRASRERMLASGSCASDAGGFVTGFDSLWDPSLYAIERSTLDDLDPLVHWLLHTGRQALADAGIDNESGRRIRGGAIVGNLAYPTEALVDLAQAVLLPQSNPRHRQAINRFSAGFPVHLLCQTLGLTAGGFALDAACASSIYAVKLACDWLQSGRADVMLAGAVNRVEGLLIHAGFTALRALSPTGQSRPFHRDADGLVPAEGAAFLVLKRLADAERSGDRILGVIRGIGLSNDGRGSGMLTPSSEGQIRAMKAAYRQSGLKPQDISLIECHATGTSVGDSIELQSMSEVFNGSRKIPIGSLKSNLGHLITVSGAAGIMKVLSAMRDGVRPATVNAAPSVDALAATPFRILESEEQWPRDGSAPRRAAINSFGFGGNNAHLLLEEYIPGTRHIDERPAKVSKAVAVVALAARAGNGESTEAFASDLLARRTRIQEHGAAAESICLPSGLIFPPKDLARTLAQQNLLLEVASEALAEMPRFDAERASAFIGMSCDAETTRTVLSLALPDLLPGDRYDAAEVERLQQSLDAGFDAARVVGCMPNIPANRLNRQFGFGGPSFTVAAEELSGIRALEIAAASLNAGEIDVALVGAADLCVEPVHIAALRELPEEKRVPGDGACVLVLKRIEDARRDGDRILALLQTEKEADASDASAIGALVRNCFGHIHAASGLLEVAAAVAMLERSAIPGKAGQPVPLLPASEPHTLHISAASVAVIAADPARRAVMNGATPGILTFAAPNLEELKRMVDGGMESGSGDSFEYRIAIVTTEDERSHRLSLARSFLSQVEKNELRPPEGIFFHRSRIEGELAFVFTGAAAAYPGMGRDLVLALPELVRGVASRCEDIDRYAGWIYSQVPEGRQSVAAGVSPGNTSSENAQPRRGVSLGSGMFRPSGAEYFAPDEPRAHARGYTLSSLRDFVFPTEFERLCGSSFLCQIHADFSQRILNLKPHAAIGLSSGETNALFALNAWTEMHTLLRNVAESGLYTTVLGGRSDAVHTAWRDQGIGGSDWANYWISAALDDVKKAVATERAVHITIVNSENDVVIGGEAEACRRVIAAIGLNRATLLGGEFAAHCPEVEYASALWRRLHHRPTRQPEGVRFYSNARGRSYALDADAVADALTGQALAMIDFPRTIRRAWEDGIRIFVEHGPRSQCTQSIKAILGDRPHLAVALDTTSRSSLKQAIYATAELWAAGVPVDIARLHSSLGLDRSDVRAHEGMFLPAHPPHAVVMAPAPVLEPLLMASVALQKSERPKDRGTPVEQVFARIAETHQAHLEEVSRLDHAYQEMQGRMLHALSGAAAAQPARIYERSFTREEIEVHASGRISTIFGPDFAGQDEYVRQVRMPRPPLLLVDRVTSLHGEALSMGRGSIVTETTIPADAWYLHQDRMAAGLAIEAGQADLMLISWLGADRLNQGRRVYRLLGCDLTYSGTIPRAGETLRYDIHVDRHASHGDVRIFFFHYDCKVGDSTRLTVRNGQAGFFTDDELAASEGVLWAAEAAEPTPVGKARRDPAPRVSGKRSFDANEVTAFADGRAVDCFGSGFERTFTHTRSPRIQRGRMQLLQTVSAFDHTGGPWNRGYLRAEWNVRPEDWFFEGHFKNDPCMPGTLMFEGCLQAMAFFLAGCGFTLERDGWRFEPVPDETYSLRCRGQVQPSSKLLTYEVFVDELIAGPIPTVYADVLCTVDGLKAFHCRRLGLRLVPDWPLDQAAPKSVFDFDALMACAWGKPSHAFGPDFSRFDGPVRVPRLPGPPYHCMSRVTNAVKNGSPVGSVAEVEYDVPSDAWYFAENGSRVMPPSVLIEVLLQPCGWLASYAGTWLDVRDDIFFRNLDGSGVFHGEVTPASGVLRTHVTLKSFSRMGSMSITAFKIVCTAKDQKIFEGEAVFGHFPADALRNQAGLAASEDERAWLVEEAHRTIQLPAPGCEKLQMIDRISGFWPEGGAARLGRLRAEKDIDPRQWFFKAHFFTDPVQPGSLGLEAVLQVLQAYMMETGCHSGMQSPRFESISVDDPVSWTYRGQVLPENRKVTILLEVNERGRDSRGVFTRASASLWVDGAKIYSFPKLGMRVVDSAEGDGIEILDPVRDTWLNDHCPTYTVPVLPMMSIVDRLAAAAQRAVPGLRIRALENITLNGWISFASGPRRLKTSVTSSSQDRLAVTLSVWRDAPHAAMSRFDVMAQADVIVGAEYPSPPASLPALENAELVHDGGSLNIYDAGELFHDNGFHFLRKLWRTGSGASFLLDSDAGAVPRGFLNQGLFDGVTHGIPNENLNMWSDRISTDLVGYPSRIPRLSLFDQPPADGNSRCEVRFAGFNSGQERFPQFRVQLSSNGRIWAEMELVYALFPKGPLGRASAAKRRAFLRDHAYVPGLALGTFENGETCLRPSDLKESDWLPGTLESAFGLGMANRLRDLAIKEHVARIAAVHPASVTVSEDAQSAECRHLPLIMFPLDCSQHDEVVRVRSGAAPRIDVQPVRNFWRGLSGISEWPLEDLHLGLIERFVRRVELKNPVEFNALRGKPAMFLANHQVAVESILFNVIISALTETPNKVVAKVEHQGTWIGRLIQFAQSYPGQRQPVPILFFDRSDPRALLDVLKEFRGSLQQRPSSLLVHVEGTRARHCRAPVTQVSSVFLDLALECKMPIVPVRFVGGLPVETLDERIEFPFAGGRQDIIIGAPIGCETLRGLTLAARSSLVLNAINTLGPADETPLPPPAPYPASVSTMSGFAQTMSVLIETLRQAGPRCAESESLLSALDGSQPVWPREENRRWMAEFLSWLKT